MSRILCLDYGKKRTGLAVSDPMQIIATGLQAVPTHALMPFLKDYVQKEEVERIVVGYPTSLDGSATHVTKDVENLLTGLKKAFPKITVETIDERFTSKIASREMLQMGMKKKERRKKENTDIIAATMMLQEYMGSSNAGRRDK